MLFLALATCPGLASAAELAITMDDPRIDESPIYSPEKRDSEIRKALSSQKIQAALYVCGHRVDNEEGRKLLLAWDNEGHWLASHTYSHKSYNSKDMTADQFVEDAFKVEPQISKLKNFHRYFRFPMLKEGNTKEKRDRMRAELKKRNYKQGYVTIDASDWYIDQRLTEKLKLNPKTDLKPYRDFYLKHIWDRARYYDDLGIKVFGREIKHTLLIHHNLLNALFLKDLIQMFKEKGWNIVSAEEAYKDEVFARESNIVPAGESLVWAAAKETGHYEKSLRYPAEDGEYEKAEMDRLGL